MRLRNKKTGEIFDGDVFSFGNMNSLAELNEEWEDYKEPKDYWYLNCDGSVIRAVYKSDDLKRSLIAIGNYFETPEEAEKAVEKLEAFKRLQDLGFRFDGIRFRNKCNYIEWKIEPKNELTDDETGELLECLYKVFGGNNESN